MLANYSLIESFALNVELLRFASLAFKLAVWHSGELGASIVRVAQLLDEMLVVHSALGRSNHALYRRANQADVNLLFWDEHRVTERNVFGGGLLQSSSREAYCRLENTAWQGVVTRAELLGEPFDGKGVLDASTSWFSICASIPPSWQYDWIHHLADHKQAYLFSDTVGDAMTKFTSIHFQQVLIGIIGGSAFEVDFDRLTERSFRMLEEVSLALRSDN